MADKVKPKVLAKTLAITALILDVAGYVWHGLLGQPSIMNVLYPGFWKNWTLMAYGLVGTVAGALALGYVVAWIYNWADKKFK